MHIFRVLGLQRAVSAWLLLALLMPTFLGCATGGPAQPATPLLAGIVVDNQRLARPGESGLVSVWRDGSRIEGRAGLQLQVGDRIDTGSSATAVIHYPSGSELLMRPNSTGRIGSFTEAIGEFFAKIRGKFAIETQFVRAGALGTQYLVRTAADGATTVIVFDGQVQVDSTTGAWRAVLAEPGTMVLAHPRSPTSMAAPRDEVARTKEWVERVERLVPASSSPGVSGKAIALTALFVGIGLAIAGSRGGEAPAPPASTGRGSASDARESTTSVAPLAAPSGATPGSSQEASPASLVCANPVILSWNVVPGAADYLVVVETRPAGSAAWRAVGTTPSRATRLATAAGLSGPYRWHVLARNGNNASPASAWLHFSCTPYVLR